MRKYRKICSPHSQGNVLWPIDYYLVDSGVLKRNSLECRVSVTWDNAHKTNVISKAISDFRHVCTHIIVASRMCVWPPIKWLAYCVRILIVPLAPTDVNAWTACYHNMFFFLCCIYISTESLEITTWRCTATNTKTLANMSLTESNKPFQHSRSKCITRSRTNFPNNFKNKLSLSLMIYKRHNDFHLWYPRVERDTFIHHSKELIFFSLLYSLFLTTAPLITRHSVVPSLLHWTLRKSRVRRSEFISEWNVKVYNKKKKKNKEFMNKTFSELQHISQHLHSLASARDVSNSTVHIIVTCAFLFIYHIYWIAWMWFCEGWKINKNCVMQCFNRITFVSLRMKSLRVTDVEKSSVKAVNGPTGNRMRAKSNGKSFYFVFRKMCMRILRKSEEDAECFYDEKWICSTHEMAVIGLRAVFKCALSFFFFYFASKLILSFYFRLNRNCSSSRFSVDSTSIQVAVATSKTKAIF